MAFCSSAGHSSSSSRLHSPAAHSRPSSSSRSACHWSSRRETHLLHLSPPGLVHLPDQPAQLHWPSLLHLPNQHGLSRLPLQCGLLIPACLTCLFSLCLSCLIVPACFSCLLIDLPHLIDCPDYLTCLIIPVWLTCPIVSLGFCPLGLVGSPS